MLPQRLRSLAGHLVGTAENVPLEARVFHAVCLMVLCGIGLNVAFNFLIGLPEVAWLMLGVLMAAATVYYTSRFLNRVSAAMAVFLLACDLILPVNYYYNSGINGPTYAIFLLCLLVTIAVAPRRQYPVWLPLNLAAMLAVFGWDYFHRDWLKENYESRGSRYLDFLYTYIIVGGLIIFIVTYIRKAYHAERSLARGRAAELAEANEVKNKLLSIIAHDLKEPLTSIQGFLELLGDKDMDAAQRRRLEAELMHRTRNASELLNNVLNWTRGQMDGLRARRVPVNLAGLLLPVIRLLEPLAEEKAINLTSAVSPATCVMGDPDMLQLVLRNLLTNAIKYSHPGGDVRITAESSVYYCVIMVRDNGDGIPPAQQARLFSLDTHSAQGTHAEKGAGLGLYLCREFMERQEGTIAFTTEAGKGTTFSVSLPCCRESETPYSKR